MSLTFSQKLFFAWHLTLPLQNASAEYLRRFTSPDDHTGVAKQSGRQANDWSAMMAGYSRDSFVTAGIIGKRRELNNVPCWGK